MAKDGVRRGSAEETRQRLIEAAIATVIDVGYYKASSNAIARHAGVTWGSINHLFGSREQLMLDVVSYLATRLEERLASAVIEGDTLEDRLWDVLSVLSSHYEQDDYLVQMQILLDLSANPKFSTANRRAQRRKNGQVFDQLAQPLFARALGEVAAEHDLVLFAYKAFRSYVSWSAVARRMAEFPNDVLPRLIDNSPDESVLRALFVQSIASTIRDEALQRGYDMSQLSLTLDT